MDGRAAPLILGPDDVAEHLPLDELVRAIPGAFAHDAVAVDRIVLRQDGYDWIAMPSADDAGLVCKIVRAAAHREGDRPTIVGTLFVFAPTGELELIADAAALTAARTAAVAAHATDGLARVDARTLAVFGTGTLAASHVQALGLVRQLDEIRVVGRRPGSAERFAERFRERGLNIRAADAAEALAGADIVATVTSSAEPVFDDAQLEPGTHVNAMGSYRPDKREIPAATVARSTVVVETLAGAWSEAGDLIQAVAEGALERDAVTLALEDDPPLASVRAHAPDAVTLFKSVGHIALDLAALSVLSRRLGLRRALPGSAPATP